MNSTKLVLKNWFHFNFKNFILLLLLFAFGHFFCSQEDCVLFKMPGTLWEGSFLPSSLHLFIKRSAQLTVVSQICGSAIPRRTVPRKDRHHKDPVQISWGYSWCNARVPRWNPIAVGCAVQGRGKGLDQCQCSSRAWGEQNICSFSTGCSTGGSVIRL